MYPVKMILPVLLAAAALLGHASEKNGSAVCGFDEKPSGDFSRNWVPTGSGNHSGLEFDPREKALTVTGFGKMRHDGKKAFSVVLERTVKPLPGNFTAVMDIKWSLPAAVFMGEVLLQVVSTEGKLIAMAPPTWLISNFLVRPASS